jgi:hypothetical protein
MDDDEDGFDLQMWIDAIYGTDGGDNDGNG